MKEKYQELEWEKNEERNMENIENLKRKDLMMVEVEGLKDNEEEEIIEVEKEELGRII